MSGIEGSGWASECFGFGVWGSLGCPAVGLPERAEKLRLAYLSLSTYPISSYILQPHPVVPLVRHAIKCIERLTT